jgi:protease I
MADTLKGKKVAIAVANEGIEQVELVEPRKALEAAGATVELLAPEAGEAQGFNHLDKADSFPVDHAIGDVSAGDYDALMLPGGVANPDNLRTHPEAVAFVRAFFDAGKPVAAICHTPWTLLEAGTLSGRTLTSYPSIRGDLRRGGATVVDQEVCVEGNLVTSRDPDDIPAFCAAVVELFARG